MGREILAPTTSKRGLMADLTTRSGEEVLSKELEKQAHTQRRREQFVVAFCFEAASAQASRRTR